jgi:hypothetical protein
MVIKKDANGEEEKKKSKEERVFSPVGFVLERLD